MKETRVLHIGMTPNYGGIESFVMNVYRNIDRSKVQFDFLTLNNTKIAYQDEICKMGGRIYPIAYRRKNLLKHFLNLPFSFFNTHKEIKVVHFHKTNLADLDYLIVSKMCNVPVRIVHSHSTGYISGLSKVTKITEKINKNILNKLSTHNFACSESAGKWLFGDLHYEIIPNAIDIEKFKFDQTIRKRIRRRLGLEGKFVIGHVGTFHDLKNQAFIVDVFNQFIERNSNSILLFVGEGPLLNQTMGKVKELKLDDRVIFLGARNNVYDYLQAMDVFVFPSKFEGLPLVLVEAQTAGLPCIVSDTVTSEVALTNQVVFRTIDSIGAWVETIHEISNNNVRYDNTKSIIKAGYDITQLSKLMEKFYISSANKSSKNTKDAKEQINT